jgi:uncharacterized protein (DUF433 family)/DNA-binding transcriptional MerR regulator
MDQMADLIVMPPRGHYLAAEAGQLAGVAVNAIGQWSRRGYIRASQSNEIPKVYSYQDVAEAMVVHDLLERDIWHREIKTAIEALTSYGDWPLSAIDLGTLDLPDRSRLVAQESGATYDIGKKGWQQVVNPENLTLISNQLRRGGWATRVHPHLAHIEVDPDRLSGRPAISGTRIAAREVAETSEQPNGIETLRDGYGLSEPEIGDARVWWHEVLRLAA